MNVFRCILLFVFATTSGLIHAQSTPLNLHHLTKEQYIQQVQLCSDSAYMDLDIRGNGAVYDGYTYEWIVRIIDHVIPNVPITNYPDREADITYHLTWHREKRNLFIGISFQLHGMPLGKTDILFGVMKDDAVQGIIKINSCKAEIRRILGQLKF